ncbi:hypothetical protein EV368DRAFT_64389 [Lentinula lateritia]|uniref:Uncharacterized protein n=1 Tax=Lentinula aff. lateritia TaxID=2804960 RepID=A0ACC1TZZ7_9AGAR|nr:hypothetical protein F5876DRAFT_65720 [Lentinula aff. lateritia]KAJ3853056.1 hypothetical protein EV368DRAFT_64389 [Lentinula lateritia]
MSSTSRNSSNNYQTNQTTQGRVSPQSQLAPNTTGNRGYVEAPQLRPPEQSYGSYAGQFVNNSAADFTPPTPQGVNVIPLPNVAENNNQEAWRHQASPYQDSPMADFNQPPLTTARMSTSATALSPAPEGVNIIPLRSIGGNESAETWRGRGRVSAHPSSSMLYPMTVNQQVTEL